MRTTSSKLLATMVLSLGFSAVSAAQAPGSRPATTPGGTASAEQKTSADRILADLKYLADDAREGRGVGTKGLDSAAVYISRQFKQAGLQPAGPEGFFQTFAVDTSAPAMVHCKVTATKIRNVVGLFPGKGKLANQTIVIGGHYDGLGKGGCGSLDPDSLGVVHNGADDNASGTAGIMEIARLLRQRATGGKDQRAILFVAFTGEELGILGSGYYVAHPLRPMDSTNAMLNLDMVGRMVDNRLQAMGTLTAVELNAVLDTVNTSYRFALSVGGDGWGSSDHAAFSIARVPVLHFFTGIHTDYHRTTDDWQKLDPVAEAKVTGFVADVAWKLATRPTPLTYVALPPPQQSAGGSGYGSASLGTLPDMASPPGGVRIQGARPGSAAEKAGLKAGDVLLKIGSHEIKDLTEMTKALQEHQPGDTVEVIFRRGEEELAVKAVLQKRG